MKPQVFWLVAAGLLAAGCDATAPLPRGGDPQFDWRVSQVVRNPDSAVQAVLEVGTPNNGARVAPLRRIRLRAIVQPERWGDGRVVWESQVAELPTMRWTGPSNLVIAHRPYFVTGYEPRVEVDGQRYDVMLVIARIGQ